MRPFDINSLGFFEFKTDTNWMGIIIKNRMLYVTFDRKEKIFILEFGNSESDIININLEYQELAFSILESLFTETTVWFDVNNRWLAKVKKFQIILDKLCAKCYLKINKKGNLCEKCTID